jgi:type II secretory pathway component PulF
VKLLLDRMVLSMPIWGQLQRERGMVRFFDVLHRQYKAGVPPAQAWTAASTSVRNAELAHRLRGVGDLMRQPGVTLQQALQNAGVFSIDDVGMVASGEKAGSIPETLDKLSSYHADAAESRRSRGRFFSVQFLIWFLLITTGAFVLFAASGYASLLGGVMDWVGD